MRMPFIPVQGAGHYGIFSYIKRNPLEDAGSLKGVRRR
jgi:hypothetical protein